MALSLAACGGSSDDSQDAPPAPPAVSNSIPTAVAGPEQSVLAGATVTLDGSASSDADRDSLTYRWELISAPAGSTASLSATDLVRPTFTADLVGEYVARLIVSDGKDDSTAATVQITAAAGNATPVARITEVTEMAVGATLTLDGRPSSDADGDVLTYAWTLTSRPADSRAELADPQSATPSFAADVAGVYVVELVVHDGELSSTAAQTTITASTLNIAPTANAGQAQNIASGSQVQLDGRQSTDSEGSPLTYQWTLTSAPEGSSAQLSTDSVAQPTFIADKPGDYVATLIVNDGDKNSAPSTVTITAVEQSIVLYYVDDSGFGTPTERLASLPFSSSASASSNYVCVGSGCDTTYKVASFRLSANGRDYTITDLQATNRTSGSPVSASFEGLRNGQKIAAGQSAGFSLRSSFTNYQTVNLQYAFKIVETGETFTYNVSLRTN